jgi:hypothetical protein
LSTAFFRDDYVAGFTNEDVGVGVFVAVLPIVEIKHRFVAIPN